MKQPLKNASMVLIYTIIILLVPVIFTLNSVKHPGVWTYTSNNPTPLGYTISLSLFLCPMFAIGWWFMRNKNVSFQKPAFLWSVTLLSATGVVLDILFGNMFFVFNNHNAVLGITLPAVHGEIPIEEFIFYITGFITVLLIYIWCDEYWLEKYNVPDYKTASSNINKILQFHPMSLFMALLLISFAVAYKKLFATEPGGFPWYFIYLTVVALTPSLAFYKSVRSFINWRALSFTFFVIVLISLIWEVTLALPYQWWDYKHAAMMGIYIKAWHNLPIEAVIVWFAVSYATVIIYETMKIWRASGKPFKQVFIG